MKAQVILAGTVLLLAAFTALSFKNNEAKSIDETTGITFFEGTWSEALEKSRAEHKPIFLDLYATWCGPCKMLKRKTFSDQASGEYFNEHYINVELDAEKGDGLMLSQKYRLTAYPSLYVIDSTGNVIIQSTGYLSTPQLVEFGKKGISKY